jgi:hypothetical protein
MQEGMYVVGVKPRSLGEGVIPVVHTWDYTRAWTYWDHNFERDLGIYQWTRGALVAVGRRIRGKDGRVFYAAIPPTHIVKTA